MVNQERLRQLITDLRNPETWPEGFEWDYVYSTSCAIGLLKAQNKIPNAHPDLVRIYLGVSFDDTDEDYKLRNILLWQQEGTTAEQMADMLEKEFLPCS